jgi:hypothetical protein
VFSHLAQKHFIATPPARAIARHVALLASPARAHGPALLQPPNNCIRHRLPLRHRAHARATRSASLTFTLALQAVPLTSLRHNRQLAGHVRVCSWLSRVHFLHASAPSLARAHALAPVHFHASRARSALLLPCTPEPHHLLPLAPRLLPSRAPTPACRHHAHARLVPGPSRHATTAAARALTASACQRFTACIWPSRMRPAWPASARPQPPACARACTWPPPAQAAGSPACARARSHGR